MSVVDMTKAPAAEAETPAKKSPLKLIIIVVVVMALLGGAAYWFLLKPPGPKKPPEPGVVVKMDSIQINLQGDHYLKIGIALQASKKAGEDLDGSKALDQTISIFSGRSMKMLAKSDYREKLKKELVKKLEKSYDDEVIGVYFTDFVTQ